MQLRPPASSTSLAGCLVLLLGTGLLFGQGQAPASVSDIFFLDLGIVIEPLTGKEQYSRLVKSPSQEVKFRINKVKSGEVYMATSKEMLGTLDRINLRIASLEQSFHVEMNRLERENEELRGILSDMRSTLAATSPQPAVEKPAVIAAAPSKKPPVLAAKSEPVKVKSSKPAAKKMPENKPAVASQKFDQAEYMAGVFAYQREDYSEALKHFDKLLLTNVSQRTTANVLYWMADSHQRQSNYQQALEILDKVLSLGQTDRRDDALIQKGLLFRKLGQEEQALFAFEKLVDEYPTSEYVKLARLELKKAEMVP